MLLVVATLALVAGPVQGQRLLTLIPPTTDSATSSSEELAPEDLAPDDLAPEIARVAVQVDLELLRTAPSRLELPTPDGRVLAADLGVFEDRGGGDLMWSGGMPQAGYDSVVLTVEGGRLVGWFGEPGGAKYRINAAPDGAGAMAWGSGPSGRDPQAFCPVGAEPGLQLAARPPLPAAAMAVDLPASVRSAQNHDHLDIVVLYTPTAALNWRNRGGARSSIRSAGDYLNMVLRNGRLGVSANIVHVAELAALDRVARDGEGLYGSSLIWQFWQSGEAIRLRREHGADMVHLFTGESPSLLGYCGAHYVLQRGESADDYSPYAYGVTVNACFDDGPIFAHEIGHGLGAHHDPANGPPPEFAFRPYAFGHGNHDRIPNAGTIMSYTGQGEPYLSSVRIRPQGRVIGIANERENERALRETIQLGVRYSDSVVPLPSDAPAAPTGLRVEMAGDVSVRLSWRDNAPDADAYWVRFWRPRAEEDAYTRSLDGRRTAVVDLPIANAGTRYFFEVRAYRGETRSARSSVVTLVVPGAEPAAPSDLAWQVLDQDDPVRTGTNAVRVTWVDNSDDESSFEVQLRSRFGSLLRRKPERADSTSTVLSGLAPGATYIVTVISHGPGGSSTNGEEVRIESPPAAGRGSVSNLTATATGATSVRLNWTYQFSGEPEFLVTAVVSGWYAALWADAGSESLEIEGLARGGFYSFAVVPYEDDGFGEVRAVRLGLGAVGRGPAAPTRLAWGAKDGVARLTWKDNASGERGFEVQWRPEYERQDTLVVGGGLWSRVALLPANATSFELDGGQAVDYRVFAYDDTGFSRASNTVRGKPVRGGESPDGDLFAVPSGETSVELTWTGRWTRPARGRLAIEARNPASGWVEVATAEATLGGSTVVGLASETPYTFRLRAGAGDFSEEVSVTTGAFLGGCRSGAESLCLRDGRFEVRAHWSKPNAPAEYGSGKAETVDVSDESGLFWFFDPANIELVVKVLDGRSINGSYWVFFGALSDVEYWITVRDVETGERQTYHNPPNEICGQKDLVAFGGASSASTSSGVPGAGSGPSSGFDLLRMNAAAFDLAGLDLASDGGGRCETGEDRLCLLDGRFAVEVDFVDPNAGTDTGAQGQAATTVPSLTTEQTGFFWFFNPSNVELAVKMLDGRALNGKFWFLYGGLSDVEYTIKLEDTVTGSVTSYRNEAGNLCGEIDTEAF